MYVWGYIAHSHMHTTNSNIYNNITYNIHINLTGWMYGDVRNLTLVCSISTTDGEHDLFAGIFGPDLYMVYSICI